MNWIADCRLRTKKNRDLPAAGQEKTMPAQSSGC